MFSLVLSFMVCLSSPSGRCQQVEMPFEGSLQQCMLFGQQEAARWVAEHAGWQLNRGWRCSNGRSA